MNSGALHLRCTEVAEVVALVMTGAVVGAATGGGVTINNTHCT